MCKDIGGKALSRYYNSSYNDIELCLRFESYAYIFTYQKTDWIEHDLVYMTFPKNIISRDNAISNLAFSKQVQTIEIYQNMERISTSLNHT